MEWFMNKGFSCIAFVGMYLLTAASWATPLPRLDVPTMVEAADTIVVGRAEHTTSREWPSPNQSFVVSVDRVLKGDTVEPHSHLPINLDLSAIPARSVGEGQFGIFFLLDAGDRTYAVVSSVYPVLVASPDDAVSVAMPELSPSKGSRSIAAGNPLGRVTLELLKVLATPAVTLTDVRNGVGEPVTTVELAGQAVLTGTTAQSQAVYSQAAEALQSIPFGLT